MELLIPRCAGMDVHQATVVITVRLPDEADGRRSITETFGTMTPDLLALRAWLQAHGVTHVAMETSMKWGKYTTGVMLAAHGVSHTGTVRPHNEDTILVDKALGLFVVADGMHHFHRDKADLLAGRGGRGARRCHRVKERQRHRHAHPFQDGATRQLLLREERHPNLLYLETSVLTALVWVSGFAMLSIPIFGPCAFPLRYKSG